MGPGAQFGRNERTQGGELARGGICQRRTSSCREEPRCLGLVGGIKADLHFTHARVAPVSYRLGVCHASSCDNVFVDTSPNQSRRYCSDRCSSRANVAAYRARQKAAAS